MTSCEIQQLKSAVVCIDTWLAWLGMCWLHRMLAVFSGCLCSLLPCVYLWHAYVILLHLAFARLHPWFRGWRAVGWGFAVTFSSVQDYNIILDKIDGKFSPSALPKSRLGKWHILASARLHPWFWRNRGLLFILLCLRLCRYIYKKGKNSLFTPKGLSGIKEEAI